MRIIEIDQPPLDERWGEDTNHRTALISEYALLPQHLRSAILTLAEDDFDNGSCECGAPVGYRIEEGIRQPYVVEVEGIIWLDAVLVEGPNRTTEIVCVDCAPQQGQRAS